MKLNKNTTWNVKTSLVRYKNILYQSLCTWYTITSMEDNKKENKNNIFVHLNFNIHRLFLLPTVSFGQHYFLLKISYTSHRCCTIVPTNNTHKWIISYYSTLTTTAIKMHPTVTIITMCPINNLNKRQGKNVRIKLDKYIIRSD